MNPRAVDPYARHRRRAESCRRGVGEVLGESLVHDGIITTEQLNRALERQRKLNARGERRRLGELLLEMRLISEAQLEAALERQRASW